MTRNHVTNCRKQICVLVSYPKTICSALFSKLAKLSRGFLWIGRKGETFYTLFYIEHLLLYSVCAFVEKNYLTFN